MTYAIYLAKGTIALFVIGITGMCLTRYHEPDDDGIAGGFVAGVAAAVLSVVAWVI